MVMEAWEVAMFAEHRQEIENETPFVELDIDYMIGQLTK